MTVNILGVKYKITITTEEKDPGLIGCDGYCDKTTKQIVVQAETSHSNLGDYSVYLKKILRHEIIHAFLFESGLHENFFHPDFGHDETYVDWIAAQYPKLKAVFAQVGCEE